MAWYDDILDSAKTWLPFQESESEAQVSITENVGPVIDVNMMLSSRYALKDLVATTKQLSRPNLPSDETQLENLRLLADTMDFLNSMVGPFTIISGYRTKELQDVLASSGDPVASGKSYHELGLAVDIYPTTMGLTEYFGTMLASDEVRSRFIEIAIKPGQNTLHLAVKSPYDLRDTKILGLNSEGKYAKLTADEIAGYIAPVLGSMDAAMDYASAKLVSYNRTPLILGAIATVSGALVLLFSSRKGKSSTQH
ncbi:MAG: M15 family metallopeptidase [Bdellovibrionaceae bacterium]|nr:M15 family metallopeptidase [Pseudobdellovibrionaceae bacterium]